MMVLQEEWHRLVSAYSADAHLAKVLWQEIRTAYTASGRHYHNLQHLAELLALAGTYRPKIQHPELVKFAIFYHDIVYSPLRNDNEEKSAQLAVERLRTLGLPEEKLQRIRHMILATKTHAPSELPDANLLLDFDLSILGAEWDKYQHYTQQVRKEYRFVPFFLYKKGRRKILQHFLNQEKIYKSSLLHERLEGTARKNLQRELALLK